MTYKGIDRMRSPSKSILSGRFKLIIGLFVFFTVLIFMFAILSQPLGIISDVLDDAYPDTDEFVEGREGNSNIQFMLPLALGAAVIIGIIVLFVFYGFKNLGGDKNSFG